MRKILLASLAATAVAAPMALASTAHADTVSAAPGCVPAEAAPAWTEIQYKYSPAKNGSGPTYWSVSNPAKLSVNGVSYVYAGSVRKIEHPAVAGVACAVTLPQFQAVNNGGDWTATVPVTPHVKTYLMGVPGHPETEAIDGPVTVKSEDVGGGQFWIKYVLDDGYVAANEGTWHVDFYAASAVTLPQFGIDGVGPTAITTVPVTPHVNTYLYGVPGHPETEAIAGPVTVRSEDVDQFWIGYEVAAGYHAVNTGTTHIDFNAS